MKKIIGIDLGGTHVRVAKVSEDGRVLQELKGPSYAQEGPDQVLENLITMIETIENWEECIGIGIGVPGPVDTVAKVMKMSTNLPGAAEYPFAKKLEERFHLPTFLDNDANVAGLAEALVGAGRLKPIVYYVTISTGVGGALIVDGQVVSGMHGYAGEIANIIIDRHGIKRNHLNAGAVENDASGTAIARIGKEKIGESIRDAKDVFELARQNDPIALEIVDQMAYDLAIMFSAIAHVADPHVFVVGGGCMKAKDCFFEKLQGYFRSMVHEPMRTVEFKEAALKEPGVIGAAMLPISHGL